MKKLFNAILIVLLAGLGAGGALYTDKHFVQNHTANTNQTEEAVAQYINNNSQEVLEMLAKSENFGNVIKSFSTVSDEEISKKVKEILQNDPNILDEYIRQNASFIAAEILGTEKFQNNANAANTAENTEDVPDENQKYLDFWAEMRDSEVAPFIGPKDAKVAVVEFFDFACGHCRSLAPVMSQLIKDNPDVKFVFQPLYFIGEYSNYAAKVSIASAEKGKFLEVFDGIMTLPEMTEETINQILLDEGLDVAEIKKMIEEKKIRRGSQDIDGLSQKLGINGVPMVFINGEPVSSRNLEELQYKINSYK